MRSASNNCISARPEPDRPVEARSAWFFAPVRVGTPVFFSFFFRKGSLAEIKIRGILNVLKNRLDMPPRTNRSMNDSRQGNFGFACHERAHVGERKSGMTQDNNIDFEQDDLMKQAESNAARSKYNDDSIQTLDALAHIRQRSGMYIGRLGDGSHPDDGIYVMFKEIMDNAVDEFIMGFGRRIDITLDSGSFTVRDYGRGIPLGKLVECVSQINTGGKFNSEDYMFSVGMNGVGTKAVNALSTTFEVTSWRDGKCRTAVFHEGVLERDEYIDPV